MPEMGSLDKAIKDLLENATYGLAALEALVDDLESRLSAARAGYLDNLNNAKLLKLPVTHIPWISAGPVAAGSTVYLYAADKVSSGGSTVGTDDTRCNFVCTRAGTIKNLAVFGENAPGAGETYVFTVQKNGVDQTLTVTVSETDKAGQDTTHSFTVAVGDRVQVKLVTSGGAANCYPNVAVEFEGA